jgi:hypothetical protein
MTGPVVLMIVGILLAVFGYTRKAPAGCPADVRRAAGLRFLWDITGGVLVALFYFAIAFGPRYKIEMPIRRTNRVGIKFPKAEK